VNEYILTLFFDFVWVVSEKQAVLLYKAVGRALHVFYCFINYIYSNPSVFIKTPSKLI